MLHNETRRQVIIRTTILFNELSLSCLLHSFSNYEIFRSDLLSKYLRKKCYVCVNILCVCTFSIKESYPLYLNLLRKNCKKLALDKILIWKIILFSAANVAIILFYINRRTFIRQKDEQFLRNSTSLLKISWSTDAVGNIDYTGRKEINLQKERERERKIQHQKAGAFSRVVHFVWLIYSRVSTEIASVNRAFKDQQNRVQ